MEILHIYRYSLYLHYNINGAFAIHISFRRLLMYINIKKYFVTLFIFIFSFASFSLLSSNYKKVVAEDLSKSVVRFHVRANSDSISDQQLKMKVKDAVVNHLDKSMTSTRNADDALSYLKAEKDNITDIARRVVVENGYNYQITASIGNSNFPDRSYGDVTFPAGEYNSFIIEIGSGKGHNWWCVLYPPLCFVDASTGILPEESKSSLKDSLSSSEYNYVSENSNEEIQVRFKYFSFLNELFE